MRTLRYFLVLVGLVCLCYLGCIRLLAEEEAQSEKKLEEAFLKISNYSTDEEKQKKLIKEVFDLKKPEVTKFLIRYMNMQPYLGMKSSRSLARFPLLLTKREEGLLWLLENYDEFTAVGRKSMVYCVRFAAERSTFPRSFECREACEILGLFLRDKTPVPTKIEGVMPGPDFPHDRVCDYAYGALRSRCRRAMPEELANELRNPIYHAEPYKERDKRINLLISWWESDDSQEFRQSKKSLLEEEGVDLPIVNKIKEQIKELEKKIEKGQPPKEAQKNPEEDENEEPQPLPQRENEK